MEKKLILILAAVFAVTAASAQKQHEINFYMGGEPSAFMSVENDAAFNYGLDLYSIYEPHTSISTDAPVLSLDYTYTFKSWLKAGLEFSHCSIYSATTYRLGNKPDVHRTTNVFALLPQAKFSIPSPEHFRLYGKVAAGLQYNAGDLIPGNGRVQFAYDIVPLGVQWGGHFIYGTAELCVGSVCMGGRIGIGINF